MSWLFYRHVGNNDNFVIQFQSEFHSWEIFYCQQMQCTLSRIIYDVYSIVYANPKRVVCGCAFAVAILTMLNSNGWTNGWLTLSTGNAKLLQHILYWHRWCSVCSTCACVSVCSSLAYCRKCKSVLLLLFSFRTLSVYSVPHSVSASFSTLRFDDDDFLHLFVLFYCWSCIANATMSMLIGFPLSSFRLPWHVHTLHHHHHFICLLFLCVKLNVAYLHSPFGIRHSYK